MNLYDVHDLYDCSDFYFMIVLWLLIMFYYLFMICIGTGGRMPPGPALLENSKYIKKWKILKSIKIGNVRNIYKQ